MKTQKLIDLERERIALRSTARDALTAIEAAIAEGQPDADLRALEAEHDKIMRQLDLLQLSIDEERLRADGDEARNSRRPLGSGTAAGIDEPDNASGAFVRAWTGGAARSGWVNERGDAVRVVGPRESISEQRHEGVGLGDAVRAMVSGARTDAERRALSEGTTTAGGFTVPSPLATWFIDRLRTESVAVRAGAYTVPMDSATMAIARIDTDPTVAWRAENAALAEGDPTFGRVVLTAKSLAGIVKFSRELFADTANAGAAIESALAKAMALEMDRASLFGDGSSNSPTGVLATSGIGSVSMGTNGAALSDWDFLLDLGLVLEEANAAAPTAMIMAPRTKTALAKLKDGNGAYMTPPRELASIPRFSTTAAPIDETQGTANDASSVLMGDFSQLLIGLREDISIKVLDQAFADHGQIALAVHARMDVQLAHKASFAALRGIIPAA